MVGFEVFEEKTKTIPLEDREKVISEAKNTAIELAKNVSFLKYTFGSPKNI